MKSSILPVPDGFPNPTPMLAIRNAAQAIEFYKQAFGATEIMRLTDPNGKIAHAEMKVGSGRIMMAEENPEFNASPQSLDGSTVLIHLYVEDADAVATKAVAAGARMVFPIKDQFYGDRSGRLMDPFGHIWIIASRKEDVSAEEMQKRFDALSPTEL